MDDHTRCATCGAPAQVFRFSEDDAAAVRTVLCSSLLCPTNLAGEPERRRVAS